MTRETYARLSGQPVYDSKGQKLGDVRRIFFDAATDRPAWVTVGARRFGGREALVPLAGSRVGPHGLAVAVHGSQVRQAPSIDAGRDLTEQDTVRASRHYDRAAAGERPAPTRTQVTAYEERLEVGVQTVETGKAKLHKHVETQPVEATVPLRHEKARVERLPADAAEPASGRHPFADEEAEITLHEERPIVAKTTVPVETVSVAAEASTEERRITDEVRRERVDVEGPAMEKAGEPTEEERPAS